MRVSKPSRPALNPLLTFFRLLFYANPAWLDKLLICVGAICATAAGVPFPLIGIIFGQLVDNINSASCATETSSSTVSKEELQHSINEKVLLLVYIAIATFVLIYTHIVCWNIASQRLAQRVRDRYLKSLLRQDIAFFDNLQAGEVSSRLNGDIQAIETGTSEKVGVFLTCISFCITAYIIAFLKDAKLAGMLISLIPAFLLMTVVGGRFVSKHSTQVSDYFSKASAIASEGLSHVGLVHALGANARLEEKFSGYLGAARREGIRKAIAAAFQAGTLYFIAFSANALAYWQGSRKIAETVDNGGNGTTAGQIYTVIFILVDGAIVLSQVAPLLPLFSGAVAAFERLRTDIDHYPSIDSTSNSGERPTTITGTIDFQNVSFTYPSRPEHPVLQDVSFQCEAGKLTAIVGLSGSGKSTIAALISRFYDPTSGIISLDGHDVKSLNVKALRGHISLVPQEPSLLDRSVLENIALGLVNSPTHAHLESELLSDTLSQVVKQAADSEDLEKCAERWGPHVAEIVHLVRKAADLADATAFIDRLENGLATSVGSSGSLISGGQKQRIALARALVRDPKILVLDEATAALDSASEQRIQSAIAKASEGRTVISIAHRLSTIRAASKIIVMKTGTILEHGTHDELMSHDGSYADLVRLQSVKPVNDQSRTSGQDENEDIDAIERSKQSSIAKNISDKTTTPAANSEAGEEAIIGKSIFKTMTPLIRPYLFLMLLAFFAAALVGGTYPASGTIFGNTLGSFSPCHTGDFIRSRGLLFSGLFFMLACVEFLANFTSWAVFGYISERLLFKVRVGTLRSLLSQPLQWHESHGRSPTTLLGYITKDGSSLAGFSGSIVGTLFSVVINFVVAVTLSLVLAWRIALVLLAIVPLLLGAGIMQFRSISRFSEKHAGAFSSSIGITVEAVSNIRTVASLSLEEEIIQTYRRSLRAPRKEMVLQSFKCNVWLAVANSLGNVLYAFAHWWGSTNILEGRYSQTKYFIILIAMLVSAQLWGQLFTLAPEISRAKSAISRIVGVLELRNSTSDVSSGISTPNTDDIDHEKKDIESHADSFAAPTFSSGAAVEFREVAFSYPARPNVQVIKSLSLSIQPGQFCALVGPSGAGKSTVLALLERFYQPSVGSIAINGMNIARLHGTSFRNEIAYVPQDNVLFHGTIKFNICLGARPGYTPTDTEIQEACELASIHETIMGLPQGYDTEVGSNGSQLSGGQRQRLSIARALVRKPKLLLLDESTSALDAESEKALELGLDRAVKGQGVTVIAIAHRLRTIARADVIFLVEGGEVVDQGRHEDLVQRSESYRVNALHQMVA
ncbi:P-loop containing nucleoside triphosphate hydrolase protein [Byssothecium circinans]|uniref:P-loop containing nucleoside triphosphate hydrolase protein n=1 Tax=Byssothecium circinans TaxID=147558 RepID=A0A6A5U7J9_9PLEO|nr:P-loop containing nucleoside triphosphate hydrolase protein [Byssothecium circinans]